MYFARRFDYSADDAFAAPDSNWNKYVFQCRVLTGLYHQGRAEFVEPPVRDANTLALYDSVVNHIDFPSIFVVFHDIQVYPEYLIVFRY